MRTTAVDFGSMFLSRSPGTGRPLHGPRPASAQYMDQYRGEGERPERSLSRSVTEGPAQPKGRRQSKGDAEMAKANAPTKTLVGRGAPKAEARTPKDFGQIVLVLQGGGALGAYQVGVYQALHEAGIEPDWVIGTSIGAINAALIAGNPADARVGRLSEFWRRMRSEGIWHYLPAWTALPDATSYLTTLFGGISSF